MEIHSAHGGDFYDRSSGQHPDRHLGQYFGCTLEQEAERGIHKNHHCRYGCIGVTFSALTILLYQGALTLLAALVAPILSDAAITEMGAVGGIMLPGLLLPAIWFAITILF